MIPSSGTAGWGAFPGAAQARRTTSPTTLQLYSCHLQGISGFGLHLLPKFWPEVQALLFLLGAGGGDLIPGAD